MARLGLVAVALVAVAGCANGSEGPAAPVSPGALGFREYAVPAGSFPHDVAVAADHTVWYTAQKAGKLGRLDPSSGHVVEVPLGDGSHPHGVIIGADGAPWVTDAGRNAIVRVDPATLRVTAYPLPKDRPDVHLNTATVDQSGAIWFTGNAGWYGRVVPATGAVEVFAAPGGNGPYGMTTASDGDVYYASLAGDHIARVDPTTTRATVLRPPTADQGSRRVWADSRGRVWCSQWDAGQVAMYDPATGRWREWRLPGSEPHAYAVFVDDRDDVWLSNWGTNALVRFESATERFTSYPFPSTPADVRQLHGRDGEIWGAESAADKIVVLRR